MKVRLNNTPDHVLEVVRELRRMGLVQGTHFDFRYCPPRYDNDGWTNIQERHTEFEFYEGSEKWATWMTLRYKTS